VNDRLNRIGERQLLIVVGVNADLFIVGTSKLEVFFYQVFNLLGIHGAVTVDNGNRADRRFDKHVERLVKFDFFRRGSGHDVGPNFVSFFVGILNHLNGFRKLVDIKSDPDKIKNGVFFRQNVVFPVGFSCVNHHRELERGFVVSNNSANILFFAEFPRTVLISVEILFRPFVADFHVIDSRFDTRLINATNKIITEFVVIDQSTIANGAIQNFNGRSVSNPRCAHVISPCL